MRAAQRLEQLVGPMLAGAIREEFTAQLEDETAPRHGYCSVAEAAKTLAVSPRQVYRLVENGSLPHRRVGERVVIPWSAV